MVVRCALSDSGQYYLPLYTVEYVFTLAVRLVCCLCKYYISYDIKQYFDEIKNELFFFKNEARNLTF